MRQLSRILSTGPRDHQALALLRVSVGLGFLLVGQYQLNHPQLAPQWQAQWQTWAMNNPLPLYGDFLQTLILPNFNAVLRTVVDMEMLIGGSFVLGLGISLTSWLALFLALNLLLAAPQSNPALLGLSSLLIITVLGLRWGTAGHYYGLEGLWRLAWKEAQLKQSHKKPANRQPSGRTSTRTSTSTRGTNNSGGKSVAPTRGKTGRTNPLRQVLNPDKRAGATENIRPFERPPKAASAKVRKLEKALKRETDRQKQQPLPEQPETKTQASPPAKNATKPQPATDSATPKPPAAEIPPEPVKVVKIFDHRSPDEDE